MKKAIVFFCLTAILWVISVVFIIRFTKSISEAASESLAKVEAPGSVIFPIETAGTVSLWHNYEDFHGGKTVSNDPALPSGYSFELRELGSATSLPFANTGIQSNVSGTQVSKKGLGTFEVATAGDYEFTVSAPTGQPRIISVSEGTLMASFGKIFGLAFGAIIPGLVGVLTLILGIVFLITKPKPKPPLSANAA